MTDCLFTDLKKEKKEKRIVLVVHKLCSLTYVRFPLTQHRQLHKPPHMVPMLLQKKGDINQT